MVRREPKSKITGSRVFMSTKYRADHIGSFLRPAELLQERCHPAFDPQRLQSLEDEHVLRILSKQKELGFEIFTDGELRRSNFMSDFTDAVEGFDMGDAVTRSWKAGEAEGEKDRAVSKVAGIVTSRLRRVRRLTGHEL